MRSCGLWPARLRHPWNFPGKSTGVGCHFLKHRDKSASLWTAVTTQEVRLGSTRPRACWCPFSLWSSRFWPWKVPGHVHTRFDWPGRDCWDRRGVRSEISSPGFTPAVAEFREIKARVGEAVSERPRGLQRHPRPLGELSRAEGGPGVQGGVEGGGPAESCSPWARGPRRLGCRVL